MSDESLPAETKDPRVEGALRDYLDRLDRGEPVSREDFLQQHAEIAGALRSFIDAEAELRKLAGGAGRLEGAGVSTRTFAAPGQETVPPKSQSATGTSGSGLAGRFGRYEIIRALGKGAMGAVYLATDTQLKRNVAIKTPHFENDPSGELLRRFYREAEAAATLRNANICPVYDVGQIDGKHFISMAYIEGKPLSDLIKSGKAQNERQIVTAIRKLALALQEAHDHGIVHRDLKPANIMVDKKGEPIIMDFGLARRRRAEGEASITHSGDLVGSPAYMSPEQIEGNPDNVGPASDQYSLGVVLYEMLTGQLPFRGSVINVLAQILTKDMTRPSALRAELDPRIEGVCLRMMAKKASDRFPSMKAVANELAAIVKNPAPASVAPASSAAERPSTASRAPVALAPPREDAGASQIRKSVREIALTESELTSLEELVRKCVRRRDYDQMIQIIERIPEDRRSEGLQSLLEKARDKTDEIAFLICGIDEADRLGDGKTALKKADELQTIKPGHHRAREIQEKYSGYGAGGAARMEPVSQLTEYWSEGGWIPWSVLAFGLAVFGVVAGVIIIWLGRTAIVIDAKDPGITVEVNDREVTINVPGEQSIRVEPGDQTLKVSYAGLETVTKSFTLDKGKTERLTVRILDNKLVADLQGEILPLLVDTEKAKSVGTASPNAKRPSPNPVAAVPHVAATNPAHRGEGFVPLFNGKDLTGWETHSSQPGDWRVANGVLICTGPSLSFLYTERADYKDFHLRVEARINEAGDSGVLFRSSFGPHWPDDSPRHPMAYEAQIHPKTDDAKYKTLTGALMATGHREGPLGPVADQLVESGKWFTLEVIAQGNHIVLKVDGRDTVDFVDERSEYTTGRIALQHFRRRDPLKPSTETVVEFRKIEIKELSAPRVSKKPAAAADGFVPLFNGKDLTGWQKIHSDTIDWTFEDGILTGKNRGGPGTGGSLFTNRADYADFHLRCETMLSRGQNANVAFRSTSGRVRHGEKAQYAAIIAGTEKSMDASEKAAATTGNLVIHIQPATSQLLAEAASVPIRVGEWFRFEVVAKGPRTQVFVKEQKVVDYVDVEKTFSTGSIGFGCRPGSTVVFRKVEIKELTSQSAATPASAATTPPSTKRFNARRGTKGK